MKRLTLLLSLVTCLFSACSGNTVLGPGQEDRGLEPTESVCNPNVQLC